MSEKHPHVSEADKVIVERFGDRLTNTGGNDPLDLLEDLANPRNTNFAAVNLPRFCLAMAVSAQVSLLRVLNLPPEPTTPSNARTVGEVREYLKVFGDDVPFGVSYDGRPAVIDVSMFADCEEHDLRRHDDCEYANLTTVFVRPGAV